MLAFGTRPEAIKMAPLYHALKKYPDDFEVLVCVTAQHRQMLDQVLRVFDITPDIDLDLMAPGQDLFDISATVLLEMRAVLTKYKPDLLLVHGDTTTTLSAALAGFYKGIPVGHIEAGLRTFDMSAPYPEEFNRQVVSKVATLHFAPTKLSRDNLLHEKINDCSITVTGNTVIDALLWILDHIESSVDHMNSIKCFIDSKLPFDWINDRFILITCHRRENFGDGFLQICRAVKMLAERFPNVSFVYPVHLNPNVQAPTREILSGITNVHLLDPFDYEPFAYLLKKCYLVLTDSGGIQEEAPSLGKPVLVMRDVTERPEAVEAGTVRLVGANQEQIFSNVSVLLESQHNYESMSKAHNPYGDGNASERIVQVLRNL
ncbi:non-hydrolyzing UDP-N-acetylglucosamine 2-epimerase [Polynucleobacter sp. HIN7]|nr:UDP-N-acetylglucosamine 2-epimerase (non-hydrolyzing) [Polynucleobacter sp. HIN7]